jgi:NADH dehydrogenase FAD-containing subunit
MAERLRVVVAGAGFAGLNVAKELEDDCDVTLIAPTDRFVFVPLIHEVASDKLLPGDVTRRLADVLPKTRLVHGRAAKVDGKHLVAASGDRYVFDVLVVAVGSEPNDFGVKGVREHALTFNNLGDALRANGTLKSAAGTVQGRPLRVTVVGAGFTGVEVSGEAAELLDKLGVARQVTLLDALPDIFPRQSPEFRRKIREGLDRRGLELRTGQKIVEVRPDGVVVSSGENTGLVPSDVTFWCAGVKPRTVEGVDPNVRMTLQSVARDDVYVVGDTARFPREKGVPQLGQTAEDQAKVVAWNVLYPEKKREYEPRVKGVIVSVGHDYAVAEISGGPVLAGRIPWHVKRQLYKAKIALA